MALRGLNPAVRTVVESMLAPEAPVVESVTPVAVVEAELLELIVEAGPNAFWVLSEDETSYELVQFPITEGVGEMLGSLMKGAFGFIKRLLGDAHDWISRRLPGGTARQLFQVYQQNPEAAREIMRDGLTKQFPADQVEQQMRVFDAKMSRSMASRTNFKKLYNHVLQNPNDQAALDRLRHLGTAEAAVQKAQADAQQAGQDPHAASHGVLKQHLGGPLRDFFSGVKDGLTNAPGAGKGGKFAGSMAHTAVPQDQMLKGQPGMPGEDRAPGKQMSFSSADDGAEAPAQPKQGDKVWAKDASGQVISGQVVDMGSVIKDPRVAARYAGKQGVLTADRKLHPMAGKDWQVGEPPAAEPQPEAQPEQPAEPGQPELQTTSGNTGSSAPGTDQAPTDQAPNGSGPEDDPDLQGQVAKPKGPTDRPSGSFPQRTEYPTEPVAGDTVTATHNGQQVSGVVIQPKELGGRKLVRLQGAAGNQALPFDNIPWKKADAAGAQQPEQPAQPAAQPQQTPAADGLNMSAPKPAGGAQAQPAAPAAPQQPAQPAQPGAQATPEPAQPGSDPAAEPGKAAKPSAQQPKPQVLPPKMAPPAKRGRMPKVQNAATYHVQVHGQPVGGAGTGNPGRFAAQMKGSQFVRALGTAMSTGVISLPGVGDISASKVTATDPGTGTTTTISISKRGGQRGQPQGVEPKPQQPDPTQQRIDL